MNNHIDASINPSLLHISDSINATKGAGDENDKENSNILMFRDYF
jgi:hypothetical protein